MWVPGQTHSPLALPEPTELWRHDAGVSIASIKNRGDVADKQVSIASIKNEEDKQVYIASIKNRGGVADKQAGHCPVTTSRTTCGLPTPGVDRCKIKLIPCEC